MNLAADVAFPLTLSLKVAALSTLAVAAIGLPLAWVLASGRFRGRAALDVAVTLPLVLPPVVTGYLLLLLIGGNGLIARISQALFGFAPGMTRTWQAAVLAAFAVSFPFTVKAARAAFESVDPELLATSYTLGRGRLATAALVSAPLAARGIIAGLVLTFARALGEFGATVMVAGNIAGRTNTMPLRIATSVTAGDWGTAGVLSAVLVVASAVFLYGVTRLVGKVRW